MCHPNKTILFYEYTVLQSFIVYVDVLLLRAGTPVADIDFSGVYRRYRRLFLEEFIFRIFDIIDNKSSVAQLVERWTTTQHGNAL